MNGPPPSSPVTTSTASARRSSRSPGAASSCRSLRTRARTNPRRGRHRAGRRTRGRASRATWRAPTRAASASQNTSVPRRTSAHSRASAAERHDGSKQPHRSRRPAVLREVEKQMIGQPHRVEAGCSAARRVVDDRLELQRVLARRPSSRTAGSASPSCIAGEASRARTLVGHARVRRNVSEGATSTRSPRLADACGAVAARRAHRRRPPPVGVHARRPRTRDALTNAVAGLARAVAARVSIADHDGVHPRLGALDVVPFVALGGTTPSGRDARDAREFGAWWADDLRRAGVLLRRRRPERPRPCPHVRAHAFRRRAPDFGPAAPHPTLGATAVGAREPLVAINCVLVTATSTIARRIARGRCASATAGSPACARSGSCSTRPARAQVSMNLVDLDRTGIEDACLHVRDARARRAAPMSRGRARRAGAAGRARSVLRRVPRVEPGSTRPRRSRPSASPRGGRAIR